MIRLVLILTVILSLPPPHIAQTHTPQDRSTDTKPGARVIDSVTAAYIRWQIAGGPKPAPRTSPGDVPRAVRTLPENGDLMAQVKMFERWFPEGQTRTPESRIAVHQELKNMAGVESAKRNALSAPPSKWQLRGPYGLEFACTTATYFAGRISTVAFGPTGSYYGASNGGLWGSALLTLVPLTDDLPTQASGSVAVDPVNPDIVYYGTGDYGAGGTTPGTGVYRSTDAGHTWEPMALNPTPTIVSKVLIAPWDHNRILVSSDRGIFLSTNGGSVWTREEWSNCSDVAATTTGSIILAAVNSGGLYKSVNQGLDWSFVPGLPQNYIQNIKVTISPSDPNRAYVVLARPSVKDDTNRTGQVRGIYTTSNLLAPTITWTDITPTGEALGYMRTQGWYHNSIVVHPTSPGTVFAAGCALIKSTNFGASWSVLVNHPHGDFREVKYRPGDNLFFTVGDGGVFTSSDGGATWNSDINQLLATSLFFNISVAKSNDDVVFGAAQDNATDGTSPGARDTWKMYNEGDGIDVRIDWSDESVVWTSTQGGVVYRTDNGGSEPGCVWPHLNDSLDQTEWSATIWQEPQFQDWVYYNGGSKIFFSSNKGNTWGEVNPSGPPARALEITTNTDGSELYALTKANHATVVRFSYTGGNTWSYANITGDLPWPLEPVGIVASMSSPERLYTFVNGSNTTSKIFRSTDRGLHWTNITGNFNQGIEIFDLLEHPADPNVLFIGTAQGVFKSSNGGAVWHWWNHGMPDAVQVTDLEYAYAAGGDYLVAGTWGRSTFERNIDAPYFFSVTAGDIQGITAVKPVGNFVLATGDSGKVAKSTDGGQNWTVSPTPSGLKLNDVHPFDSLKYIVMGDAGTIIGTTDGGANWIPQASPTGEHLRRMAFTSPTQGFAVGDNGIVLRTTDAGDTWEDASPGLNASFFDIFFTDELHGFLAGHVPEGMVNERRLLKTTDGGQTWDLDPALSSVGSFFDIFFTDTDHGFMTMDNGSVMTTTDGGGSWAEIPTGAGVALLACYFSTPTKGWVCGVEGVAFSTTDGGGTWVEEESGTPENLNTIASIGGNLFYGGGAGLFTQGVLEPASVNRAMAQGWGLVSVPFGLQDYSSAAVFPGASSNLYAYIGGYEARMVLENGTGYWVKYNAPATVPMIGTQMLSKTIDVAAGWNLIGSISAPIPVQSIEQDPPGNVTSQFFGYEGSYAGSGTIEPGRGYWVKVTEDGRLRLDAGSIHISDPTSGGSGQALSRALARVDDFNRMALTDAKGRSQTLYYSVADEDEAMMRFWQAPPAPPEGGFDVRFATGAIAEAPRGSSSRSVGIGITSAAYPVTVRWESKQTGVPARITADGREIVLEGSGSLTLAGPSSAPALQLPAGSGVQLPVEFALLEAYPNPFNPSTTIRYELPGPSPVSIVVYDVLGRALAALVDGVEDAGYRSVVWDASGVSGGVYFYRMEAGRFTAVRKVVVMK